MARYELKDEHWALVEPVLPPRRPVGRGGVWRVDRIVVSGILWVLFSGAAGRDLPERYGPRQTACDRFGRWRKDGTRDRVLKALRLKADAENLLDYTQSNADSTSVRTNAAAAGAKKKDGPQALGMTRGGWGSKVRLMTDATGLPVGMVLTQGNRSEYPVFPSCWGSPFTTAADSRRHWRPAAPAWSWLNMKLLCWFSSVAPAATTSSPVAATTPSPPMPATTPSTAVLAATC